MGTAMEQSREYVYIQDVQYNPSAAVSQINVGGGHTYRQMVFFWPVLAPGSIWPDDVTDSRLSFLVSSIPIRTAQTTPATDAYGTLNGRNRFITYGIDMHPDQHNFLAIPTGNNAYQILSGNDGGIFLTNSSMSPGLNPGDWSMRGVNLRVTQFYGADKRPGSEQFFGGTQDNGTWISPAETSAKAN